MSTQYNILYHMTQYIVFNKKFIFSFETVYIVITIKFILSNKLQLHSGQDGAILSAILVKIAPELKEF